MIERVFFFEHMSTIHVDANRYENLMKLDAKKVPIFVGRITNEIVILKPRFNQLHFQREKLIINHLYTFTLIM